MKLQLSDEQAKEIAVAWIKEQHKDKEGAKVVLNALFYNAHFANWAWDDLLQHAVNICSKQYAVSQKQVLEMLK